MKTKVLMALRDAGGFVSGQRLCDELGVSRTAVWKVISQLKECGYEIESVRNKGYRLISAPDVFSEAEIKVRLHTETIGQHLLYYDELDSTNAFFQRNGDQYPHGTVVVADNQTAGKGSHGRKWESPGSVAIYMSVLLKPDIPVANAPRLTPVMALSTARALSRHDVPVLIKWPNDIVLNGKKLVGILTEMHTEIDYVNQIVIGIGINVLTEQFSEEIADRATSLLIETGKRFSRAELAAEVLNCFEEDYAKFLHTCDLTELLGQYERFSATIGREVRILDRRGEYNGRALSVDSEGRLLVEKEDKEIVKVFADEVSVRGIYGYA